MYNGITDIPGFSVGHAQDFKGATGCTVILCPPGTVGGIDVRGSAAGTRQTDSLLPFHSVDEIHAVLLSGGSAFGLDASGGVLRFLEAKGIGHPTPTGVVPIVPTAILYDLGLGESRVRPDAEMGHQACLNSHGGKTEEGSVGAGTGATVGKLMGMQMATKGGLGTCAQKFPDGGIVAALVVVNAFGDVLDSQSRKIIAGARDPQHPSRFIDSAAQIRGGTASMRANRGLQNTTLGVVATNVKLSKRQAIKVAQMAQSGFSRTLSPVHSTVDGDLVIALSAGNMSGELNAIGLMAQEVVAEAICRAVREAKGLGFLPAYRDLQAE
jgi:L-aminopeptidase/D-esterase-like protein